MRPFTNSREKSNELFKFIKGIFSKKTLKKVADELVNPGQSDGLKAFSAGLGIFLGIMPVWGLQTVAAIFAAVTFKLNKALVVIFSQISFPPFMPLILLLSYRFGKIWIDVPAKANLNMRLVQYLYGSITLGIIAGIAVGVVTYLTLKLTKALKQYQLTTRLKKVLPAQ